VASVKLKAFADFVGLPLVFCEILPLIRTDGESELSLLQPEMKRQAINPKHAIFIIIVFLNVIK
jgi:hypothetical protein